MFSEMVRLFTYFAKLEIISERQVLYISLLLKIQKITNNYTHILTVKEIEKIVLR